jgi:hypothetical protein
MVPKIVDKVGSVVILVDESRSAIAAACQESLGKVPRFPIPVAREFHVDGVT